jgi:hypothetical protein
MSELRLWNVQQLLTRNHVWMNTLGSHYEVVEIRLGQGVVGVAWRLAQAGEKQLVGYGELSSMRGEAMQGNGDIK